MPADLRNARAALWSATAGYALDAMDVLLYVFAIGALRDEFGFSNAEAGLIGSATLIASAFGGVLTGILADRFGRRRMLMLTILIYSAGSAGSASAQGFLSLIAWRSVVGLGLGGEWSAGATLVAETWPAAARGRAIGVMQSGWAIGYMLAAVVSGLVLPTFGWRVLFLMGLLPALLTIFIRRTVQEPEIWLRRSERNDPAAIFRQPLLPITARATMLAASTLLGYWGLFTWLPGFLSAPSSAGGAGLNIVRTSGWIFLLQAGALAGYISFGFLADRFGRRPVFATYVLTAAVLVPLYASAPSWGTEVALLWMGPLVGFAGSGYFSLFGAMLAELYPTAVRGIGQGFTYNSGRLFSAFAPWVVGAVADRSGFGAALALNSAFFVVAAVLVFTLPETRHTELSGAMTTANQDPRELRN